MVGRGALSKSVEASQSAAKQEEKVGLFERVLAITELRTAALSPQYSRDDLSSWPTWWAGRAARRLRAGGLITTLCPADWGSGRPACPALAAHRSAD